MDIRNKEILITGGAGFIGSNLVHRLYKDNHVYVMDDLQTGSMSNLNDILPDIDFIKDRVENINNYCLDVDYIFHIGIYSSSPMYRNNPLLIGNAINDMIKILELAKKNKSKIVYASTSSIYNEIKPPHSENVIPKVTDYYTEARIAMERVAELYDKLYGMDVSAMRFFSIYGYHEKSKKIFANLVSQFLWDIHDDIQPVLYGDGEQRRDFVFVDDVVDALTLAALNNHGFNVYNVGTGKNYSLNQLVDILNKHLKKNVKPKYIEMPIKNYVHETLADTKKAEERIGFKAKVSLDEGIDKLIEYYKY
ncbi:MULTISPECIES: NAD-dependent epimerase/dehydratase family protein [Acidiplasma]|jgi:UDP-glucose 4-epimerase|uniref:Nucleoside-diphosphate sugar epimerase n=2 Tax=Acidiplasma TaxID=507753 RepID=A0A0Q0VQB7_9ARCH|nr:MULTISPECIES: NAD-dependent epimerase/dehydratase family protein [Acidiplasma]KJE49728.1 nucleoside-diphosphate sugar epimerase [Acidiplasma sp. MBA-1]KPV47225.1 nucleoside-diphosphate sugar epimerase [Acidiplasma aeolicum]KQB34786.1 nucleoside-diphosphate sugar epimerase [Acidiplasma aeolicum]KQB36009.1 nucleoside-diphosphate sugar epimerase [Acidiplasma cupricumulans]WMT55676.1 MAG: NAD-dependent epimerase/dehydratase family protein [Acidiplasma sp.]